MSSLLDIFQAEVVGGKGRIEDYIATISSKGDFNKVKDFAVILNSWNNLLQTPRRSYTFDPDYGSDLYKYVFEPADSDTIEGIEEEVNYRIMQYDDRARITGVVVKFLPNLKGFTVDVTVSYLGKTGSFKTVINESSLSVIT